MDNQAKRDGANRLAAAFASALAQSMGRATGAPWPLEVIANPDPTANKGTPIHFRLTAEGSLCGECYVELFEPPAAELASKILKQPVSELADVHTAALERVVAAAAFSMTTALAEQYGNASFRVERVRGLAFGGMFVVPLGAAPDQSKPEVLMYFGTQLLQALCGSPEEGRRSGAANVAVPVNNLKLVMDVELNVSLRFGQRQMPLREVLDLASGSVVELDRMVDEPVELFLDGRLIARGEAVVVDGNYGLRVTEIPQPVASHFLN